MYANEHTDEDKQRDKKKATAKLFGVYGCGYAQLLTHSAVKHEMKADAFKVNADYKATLALVDKICAEAHKENAFNKDSKSGYCEQLALALDFFLGDRNSAKLTYHHYERFAKIVCNCSKRGKVTIADKLGVIQALAIVYRYAYNGYKLPTKDRSDIYTVNAK